MKFRRRCMNEKLDKPLRQGALLESAKPLFENAPSSAEIRLKIGHIEQAQAALLTAPAEKSLQERCLRRAPRSGNPRSVGQHDRACGQQDIFESMHLLRLSRLLKFRNCCILLHGFVAFFTE